MAEEQYLITKDQKTSACKVAREALREKGTATLRGQARWSTLGTYVQSGGALVIPDDAVLLMIGHTSELLAGCGRARTDGNLLINTETQKPLERLFGRIKISIIQTDTVLAIFAKGLWPGAWATGNRRPVVAREGSRRGWSR